MKTPLGQILIDSGIITAKTLDRALTRQQGSGNRLGTVLEEMGVITPEELLESLAKQSGLETATRFASGSFDRSLLELIPRKIALEKLAFPLKQEAGALTVAVADPFDTDTLRFLERLCALAIVPVLAGRDEILDAVHQHYPQFEDRHDALKILVADDSTEVTAEIAAALRKEGYRVLTANDGVTGLTIAFSEKPDLILCGQAMPRMDGYALMRAVKANPATADTPMILLTSKNSPEEKHRALKSGFHDFLVKPMMAVRVVSRVQRAFDICRQLRCRPAAPTA